MERQQSVNTIVITLACTSVLLVHDCDYPGLHISVTSVSLLLSLPETPLLPKPAGPLLPSLPLTTFPPSLLALYLGGGSCPNQSPP